MAAKQIQFVADLKTQLTAKGYTNIKEWTPNYDITLAQNYEIIINSNNTNESYTARTAVRETGVINVMLFIKSSVISNNIENLRRTEFDKINDAILDVADALGEGDNAKITVNQPLATHEILTDNPTYIGYAMMTSTTFINDYS